LISITTRWGVVESLHQLDETSSCTTLNIPQLCNVGPAKLHYRGPQLQILYSSPRKYMAEQPVILTVRLCACQKAMSGSYIKRTLVYNRSRLASDHSSLCRRLPVNYKKGWLNMNKARELLSFSSSSPLPHHLILTCTLCNTPPRAILSSTLH
jgi:hypothetical protein